MCYQPHCVCARAPMCLLHWNTSPSIWLPTAKIFYQEMSLKRFPCNHVHWIRAFIMSYFLQNIVCDGFLVLALPSFFGVYLSHSSFLSLSLFSFIHAFRIVRISRKLSENVKHFSDSYVNRHITSSILATKMPMFANPFFGYLTSFFYVFFWLGITNTSWKPPQHVNILFFCVIVNVCVEIRLNVYSIAFFHPFFRVLLFFIRVTFSFFFLFYSIFFNTSVFISSISEFYICI